MTNLDELAQLEAERDRIRAMIAYHHGPFYDGLMGQPPHLVAAAVVVVVGAAGAFFIAGTLAALVAMGALVLAMYILSRSATVFGLNFRLGDLFSALDTVPMDRPAGEPEALQRLAHCEARIKELKQGRA
jgi:hypothetical protein